MKEHELLKQYLITQLTETGVYKQDVSDKPDMGFRSFRPKESMQDIEDIGLLIEPGISYDTLGNLMENYVAEQNYQLIPEFSQDAMRGYQTNDALYTANPTIIQKANYAGEILWVSLEKHERLQNEL